MLPPISCRAASSPSVFLTFLLIDLKLVAACSIANSVPSASSFSISFLILESIKVCIAGFIDC